MPLPDARSSFQEWIGFPVNFGIQQKCQPGNSHQTCRIRSDKSQGRGRKLDHELTDIQRE